MIDDWAMTLTLVRAVTLGVEKYSDALGQCSGMAQLIHGDGALDDDGEIILARRIDSQAKHGVLARAGAEFYVKTDQSGICGMDLGSRSWERRGTRSGWHNDGCGGSPH